MKVEIFTLSDAATTYAAGKLNILGSFDRLNATQTPVMHPQCALAIKLRFERVEEGTKSIRIQFVDVDGKSVMPTLNTTSQVQFGPNDSTATASLVLVIQQLKLPKFGEYSIDLAVDGHHEGSIPLVVTPPT
jgi:hypothetical protein